MDKMKIEDKKRIIGTEYNKGIKQLEEEGKSKEYIQTYMQEAEKKRQNEKEWKLDIANFEGVDWENANPNEKPLLELPQLGKLISSFAGEISKNLKDTDTIFFRPDSKDIVEIETIKTRKDSDEGYTGFVDIKPNRFITLVEKYITPGQNVWNDKNKEWEFKPKSIGRELANTILHSEILHLHLPKIHRIFTIPIPIINNGGLTFPAKGYDERFESWLPENAPQISNPNMSLEEAKKLIESMLNEFCFQDKQDYTNAIAAIITPFLRGIYPTFSTRTPVFFYMANRERAGKDYLAGIRGIIYEGYALEESPISSSENAKSNNTEELRKKLLAAMISGRKRLHFSNNKGYINNAVFEAVLTTEKHSDRVLGRNEVLQFDNELDFSLSGNVGVGFTPDFANRARFIRLFLDIEDANSRRFNNPNLHLWVKEHRSDILSALYSLVQNWMKKGKPEGSIPFTSFPSWAKICGGVMEAAGYDSPCNPDKEVLALGGDNETKDMKSFFELGYDKYPEQWMTKKEMVLMIIRDDTDLFGYLDFDKRNDQTKFGMKVTKFIGRVLSDVRLIVDDRKVRASRQRFKFSKETRIEENKKVFGNLDNESDKISSGNRGGKWEKSRN